MPSVPRQKHELATEEYSMSIQDSIPYLKFVITWRILFNLKRHKFLDFNSARTGFQPDIFAMELPSNLKL